MPHPFAVEHAGWEVMWVTKKAGKKRIVAIDFDEDFVGALELYNKATKGGKKLATLRCKNVGFPPPERYRDKLRAYNRNGVWWCPYCMQLRRFEKRAWDEVEGEISFREPAYYCPLCDISHRDFHVRRWNPMAARLYEGPRRRSSSGRKRRRSK